jgi:alpha-galactosidase
MLQEDVADSVSLGRSWRGTPFQISEKTYSHGLAFNANKTIGIYLDRPGGRFTSDIGIENNDDTRRGAETGHGSVTFHIRVGDQELLTSPVMRLKDAPRSISVPLNGAREFEIRVGDGGDGRGWDQALWGGAQIAMQDGTRLRLQDLALSLSVDDNPARISFILGGKPSAALLPNWTREVHQSVLPGVGESFEVVYQDPESRMEVRLHAKCFKDFPAVEWLVRFKNNGDKESPLLENIQAMDTVFRLPGSGMTTLHWAKGGVATFDDFAPQTAELKPGASFTMAPQDGRSSSEILPFFNLEGAGAGVVLAVGWSGRWAAKFEVKNPGAVRVNAGMATTRLVLHPGEEIRTPSMLVLHYEGNRWRGQNLLRQFILAHHRPKKNGQPLRAPITCGNWGSTPSAVHMDNIRKFIQHRLPIDYYWIDAGWYGKPIVERTESWAASVGDWRVKTNLYPEGFRPISDLLRQDHRELMLWFEPERVFKGTPWHQEHSEWVIDRGGDNLLMNLGNTNACRFVTGFIASRIDEFGLGCYRQDFNMDPVPFWNKADTTDRQGIAEIRHIEGLYAFWDDLLRRHPHLIIDNCASGGRRIDLETVGRATPFWRTDGPRDAIAHQCHSYGLLAWVPFSAISQDREGDTYEFRSSMCSSLCINWNHSGDGPSGPLPENFPFDWARKTLEQYISIRDFYYGDYYPLTGYSQATDQWMAYQLDRPDTGQGLVVALRRPESPYETSRFRLQGLDETASYQITDLDTGAEARATGHELSERGLLVAIDSKPGSILLVYRKR